MTALACSVEGCSKGGKITRGMCDMHYCRWRRYGTTELIRTRPPAPCGVPSCPKPRKVRDWCGTHYERWRRTGDPMADVPVVTLNVSLAERLARHTEILPSGCWYWAGTKDQNGYGSVAFDGSMIYAHRASYELRVGPIPEGLELDHLCCNRSCVNPDHLEPVTHKENCRRARARALERAR